MTNQKYETDGRKRSIRKIGMMPITDDLWNYAPLSQKIEYIINNTLLKLLDNKVVDGVQMKDFLPIIFFQNFFQRIKITEEN